MAQAIPVGIMAGKAIYGAVQNHKAGSALKKAQAERQGMLGQTTGVANNLTNTGNSMTGAGMGGATSALNYYQTLLGGNRAAMGLATAAPRAEITDQFRGAERSLEHSGVRGAAGDQAKADLIRDRTSRISGLTTGVQPMAANALAGIGTTLTGQGGQRLGAAGNLWGAMLGNSQANQNVMQERKDVAGAQFGSSLFDLIGGVGKMATDKWGGGPKMSTTGPFAGGYQFPRDPGMSQQY